MYYNTGMLNDDAVLDRQRDVFERRLFIQKSLTIIITKWLWEHFIKITPLFV